LSRDDLRALYDSGRSVLDILAGKVPELDPVEIITTVWEDNLPDDEYARATGQLPNLFAEYQTSEG
jgi:hypothetical protein